MDGEYLVDRVQMRNNGPTPQYRYVLTKRGRAVAGAVKSIKSIGVCLYGMHPYCQYTKCSSCRLFVKSR